MNNQVLFQSNVPASISDKRKMKLHNNPSHPIAMMKQLVQSYEGFKGFTFHDDLSEEVAVQANFDLLLVPENHPARRMTDTYYTGENTVLRTHTSAHQNELMLRGERQFLACGDVYRKDTIDRSHFPVFHQIEGVKICENPLEDLTQTLSGLIEYLFPDKEYRFLPDDFPFTFPSLQAEVHLGNDKWMEILGAGVIQPKILENCGIEGTGWAFGLGLDRLLMHRCEITDIRYLWSQDERFLSQFANGLTTFKPYSKYPTTFRDISFWVNDTAEGAEGEWSMHNDFCEQARDLGNDLIESIELIDRFAKNGQVSFAYRFVYGSNDRTLQNDEINAIQSGIRQAISSKFGVILR
jgi:phenylalanyl-tRNA synthetase alpha chain